MSADPFAPVRQVQALARVADTASAKILAFLLDNPQDPDSELWRRAMRDLDAAAARLDGEALRLMAQISDKALKALTSATAEAERFTRETAEIKKGLKVFAAILGLAGALLAGAGAASVISAAKAVRDAAKKDEDKKPK
ncbi:MAG: hypothetical protein HZC37_27505 [Burkholderiales bacterium]|nr:hypothetical protein [Burkholderiales bacterium]